MRTASKTIDFNYQAASTGKDQKDYRPDGYFRSYLKKKKKKKKNCDWLSIEKSTSTKML